MPTTLPPDTPLPPSTPPDPRYTHVKGSVIHLGRLRDDATAEQRQRHRELKTIARQLAKKNGMDEGTVDRLMLQGATSSRSRVRIHKYSPTSTSASASESDQPVSRTIEPGNSEGSGIASSSSPTLRVPTTGPSRVGRRSGYPLSSVPPQSSFRDVPAGSSSPRPQVGFPGDGSDSGLPADNDPFATIRLSSISRKPARSDYISAGSAELDEECRRQLRRHPSTVDLSTLDGGLPPVSPNDLSELPRMTSSSGSSRSGRMRSNAIKLLQPSLQAPEPPKRPPRFVLDPPLRDVFACPDDPPLPQLPIWIIGQKAKRRKAAAKAKAEEEELVRRYGPGFASDSSDWEDVPATSLASTSWSASEIVGRSRLVASEQGIPPPALLLPRTRTTTTVGRIRPVLVPPASTLRKASTCSTATSAGQRSEGEDITPKADRVIPRVTVSKTTTTQTDLFTVGSASGPTDNASTSATAATSEPASAIESAPIIVKSTKQLRIRSLASSSTSAATSTLVKPGSSPAPASSDDSAPRPVVVATETSAPPKRTNLSAVERAQIASRFVTMRRIPRGLDLPGPSGEIAASDISDKKNAGKLAASVLPSHSPSTPSESPSQPPRSGSLPLERVYVSPLHDETSKMTSAALPGRVDSKTANGPSGSKGGLPRYTGAMDSPSAYPERRSRAKQNDDLFRSRSDQPSPRSAAKLAPMPRSRSEMNVPRPRGSDLLCMAIDSPAHQHLLSGPAHPSPLFTDDDGVKKDDDDDEPPLSRASSGAGTERSLATPLSSTASLLAMVPMKLSAKGTLVPRDDVPGKLFFLPPYPGIDDDDDESVDAPAGPAETEPTPASPVKAPGRISSLSRVASAVCSLIPFVSPAKKETAAATSTGTLIASSSTSSLSLGTPTKGLSTSQPNPVSPASRQPLKAIPTAEWPSGSLRSRGSHVGPSILEGDLPLSTIRKKGVKKDEEMDAKEEMYQHTRSPSTRNGVVSDENASPAKRKQSHKTRPSLTAIPPEVVDQIVRATHSPNALVPRCLSRSSGPDERPSVVGFFTSDNAVAVADVDADVAAQPAKTGEVERPDSPDTPFEYDAHLDDEKDDDAGSDGTITPSNCLLPPCDSLETVKALSI